MSVNLAERYPHYIEDTRFQYKVLDKQYKDAAIAVMTESFCDYEPMTKFINVTYDEFSPFAEIVVEKAIEDKLSIVALDGKRVVACTAVEDLVDPAPIDLSKLTPKFNYIFGLLESISGSFFQNKQIDKNIVSHLFITAVHPDYHRQGLSRQINFQSMKLAIQRNFDFMLSELTNWYNEKGLLKYMDTDKKLLGKAVYHDYQQEGKQPFKGLSGEAHSYIWQLRDNLYLPYKDESGEQKIRI